MLGVLTVQCRPDLYYAWIGGGQMVDLSLFLPIPPATVSFHATAIVHTAGTLEIHSLSKELESLLPVERRGSSTVIEIVPEDASSPTDWECR